MNNKLIFVAGVVIGGIAGVIGTKKYFEKRETERADKEIASVKEVWAKRQPIEVVKPEEEKTEEPVAKTEPKWNKPDLAAYSSLVNEYDGKDHSEDYKERLREVHERGSRPYVISPDEFGDREGDGYDSISLTYYLDGTLAEGDEVIEDIDKVIGLTSLNHFGEYEDDSVFVRNDELRCDYEVLLDQRSFKDAMR